MSNILAGLGIGQMSVLDEYVKKRRQNNLYYKSIFEDLKGIKLLEEESKIYYSNHWLSCILIDNTHTDFDNKKLKILLFKENIESRFLWKPLHTQPVFKKYNYFGNNESVDLFNRGLALPSGSSLTLIEKNRIVGVIKKLALVS